MLFVRGGSGECLVAGEEEAKGINLGSPGWTCWHKGTRRSASLSGVCRNGEGIPRCVCRRVPMVTCIFVCVVLVVCLGKSNNSLLGAAGVWLRQKLSQRVAGSPAPKGSQQSSRDLPRHPPQLTSGMFMWLWYHPKLRCGSGDVPRAISPLH